MLWVNKNVPNPELLANTKLPNSRYALTKAIFCAQAKN
jgi:hypothetical protein